MRLGCVPTYPAHIVSSDSEAADMLATARSIAAEDDGLRRLPAFPSGIVGDLDAAEAQAARTRRPVSAMAGASLVTVFPRGTKPGRS